jgi:hypothetical protein
MTGGKGGYAPKREKGRSICSGPFLILEVTSSTSVDGTRI